MPYRKIPLAPHNYYHIYNRGNNRQKIFFEEDNYYFLLRRIRENIIDFSDVLAYCLMPNHYHLLVKIIDEEGFIKGIKKTFISYTKAINKRYNRSGHLFEGRYQYKFVPEDNYLLHLSRYIHLNPVRSKLTNNPANWPYSSYCEYIGKRKIDFIKPEIVLLQIKNYQKFVYSFQDEQGYYLNKLIF